MSNKSKEWVEDHTPLAAKKFMRISNKKQKESSCFDIKFFDFGPWYRIIFVLCSIISIGTYGYFYCLCLPYVFFKFDVMQDIAKVLTRRGEIEKEAGKNAIMHLFCYHASILCCYLCHLP